MYCAGIVDASSIRYFEMLIRLECLAHNDSKSEGILTESSQYLANGFFSLVSSFHYLVF